MSMILTSPQAAVAALFEGASRQQGFRLNRVEHTKDGRLPLRMKWVVESDEHGLCRLCMRWNAAPFSQHGKPGHEAGSGRIFD